MMSERVLSLTKRYLPVAFGVLMLAAATISRFAVLSNDSFPLLWQAKHLSVSHPSTFYNRFFPVGDSVLMRMAAVMHKPLLTLEIVQVVLVPFFVLLACLLFARLLKPVSVLFGLLILSAYPDMVRSVLSVTPDYLAAFAAIAAFYFTSREQFGFAGIALGLGLLFRTHIVGLVPAFVIAIVSIQREGRIEICGRLILGALPFILLQGIVQVWSGHEFFESAQTFNVYRMMYGVDWNTPPHVDSSVFEVIAS